MIPWATPRGDPSSRIHGALSRTRYAGRETHRPARMPNDCKVLPSIVRVSRGGTRLGLIAAMLKHKTPRKSLTLNSEMLRTLQTQELRHVAGGYTNESLANDKSCKICETDICEF
jgi:hypothetical protein